MLVDIPFNVVDDATKQKIIDICGEYIDTTPHRISKGLYYSYLNFTHTFDIEKKSYNEYPTFVKKDSKWIRYSKYRCDALDTGDKNSKFKKEFWLDTIKDEEKKPDKVFNNKRKMKRLSRKNECSTHINSYGVVDSYNQLLSLYDFERDTRKFAIFFTPISKQNQEEDGGWRWSKWGPYYGTQKPQTEYLYDDPKIDLVFVYHIIEILD